MAQGNKIYQALDTQTILVSKIDSSWVLVFMGFVEKKKNIKYHQTYN